jgi:hypothetical protein
MIARVAILAFATSASAAIMFAGCFATIDDTRVDSDGGEIAIDATNPPDTSMHDAGNGSEDVDAIDANIPLDGAGEVEIPIDANTPIDAHVPIDANVPVDAGSLYFRTIMNDTPVAYYRLDEASGSAINFGSSGSSNAGAYTSSVARAAPGLINGDGDLAAMFASASGSSSTLSYVSVPPGMFPMPTSALTIECWIKATAFNTPAEDENHVVAFGDGRQPQASPFFEAYVIQIIPSSGELNFYVGTSNSQTSWPSGANPEANVAIGVTTHLVVTYTPSGGTIYVNNNGTSYTASNVNLDYSHINGQGLGIGGNYGGYGNGFTGTIDEVAIYDKALDGGTVNTHYVVGSTGHTP